MAPPRLSEYKPTSLHSLQDCKQPGPTNSLAPPPPPRPLHRSLCSSHTGLLVVAKHARQAPTPGPLHWLISCLEYTSCRYPLGFLPPHLQLSVLVAPIQGSLPATVCELEPQSTPPCPFSSFPLFHRTHHHRMHFILVYCLLSVSPQRECKL